MQRACRLSLSSIQSEYFHRLSKEPVISNLVPREVLDGGGGRAIEVQLYCIVNGVEKVCTCTCVGVWLWVCVVGNPLAIDLLNYVQPD